MAENIRVQWSNILEAVAEAHVRANRMHKTHYVCTWPRVYGDSTFMLTVSHPGTLEIIVHRTIYPQS